MNIETKIKGVHIYCEMTVAIAQFENIKPRIELDLKQCTDETITEALDYCKNKMSQLYKNIKSKNGGK